MEDKLIVTTNVLRLYSKYEDIISDYRLDDDETDEDIMERADEDTQRSFGDFLVDHSGEVCDFILDAYVGTWQGTTRTSFLRTNETFEQVVTLCMQNQDDCSIVQRGKELIIETANHDAKSCFSVWKINSKGKKYFEQHGYGRANLNNPNDGVEFFRFCLLKGFICHYKID